MDLDQLKQILDLVREHELAEFEVEQDGLRLKIRKDAAGGLRADSRRARADGSRRRRPRRRQRRRPPLLRPRSAPPTSTSNSPS